jgi:hypothetical protein
MRPHSDTCASNYAHVGADAVPQPHEKKVINRTLELQSLYPQAFTLAQRLLTAAAVVITAYTGLALLSFCVATLGGAGVLTATLGLAYGAVVILGITRILQDLRHTPRAAAQAAAAPHSMSPPRTHPVTFAALVDNDVTVVDNPTVVSKDLPRTEVEKTVQMRMVYDL